MDDLDELRRRAGILQEQNVTQDNRPYGLAGKQTVIKRVQIPQTQHEWGVQTSGAALQRQLVSLYDNGAVMISEFPSGNSVYLYPDQIAPFIQLLSSIATTG